MEACHPATMQGRLWVVVPATAEARSRHAEPRASVDRGGCGRRCAVDQHRDGDGAAGGAGGKLCPRLLRHPARPELRAPDRRGRARLRVGQRGAAGSRGAGRCGGASRPDQSRRRLRPGVSEPRIGWEPSLVPSGRQGGGARFLRAVHRPALSRPASRAAAATKASTSTARVAKLVTKRTTGPSSPGGLIQSWNTNPSLHSASITG